VHQEEEEDGEEAEPAAPSQLLNPLREKSAFDGSEEEEEEEEEEDEVPLGLEVVVLHDNEVQDGPKNLDYTEVCKIKQGFVNL